MSNIYVTLLQPNTVHTTLAIPWGPAPLNLPTQWLASLKQLSSCTSQRGGVPANTTTNPPKQLTFCEASPTHQKTHKSYGWASQPIVLEPALPSSAPTAVTTKPHGYSGQGPDLLPWSLQQLQLSHAASQAGDQPTHQHTCSRCCPITIGGHMQPKQGIPLKFW